MGSPISQNSYGSMLGEVFDEGVKKTLEREPGKAGIVWAVRRASATACTH